MKIWPVFIALTAALAGPGRAQDKPAGPWLHADCAPLDISKHGPFALDEDGGLLMVATNRLCKSSDDGKTWTDVGTPIPANMRLGQGAHPGQFLRTASGAVVVAYLDFTGYVFSWDDANNKPNPTCKLELHAVRSTDRGQTWINQQCLLDGYNADFMGFIQTRTGRLVLAVEHLAPELCRWVVCSFVSDDDARTWQRSNWIDLGGRGHHEGAVEPAVAELSDGRLLMMIRTNLDRFWSAYSDDQGSTWRVIQPTSLDASTSPGWLLRLQSGRLAFVWNRLNPEGRTWPRSPAGSASSAPVSWHREELSLAFSNDDGVAWSEPVVVARWPGGQLAYPYLFERRPGEIWLTTHSTSAPPGQSAAPLAVRIADADFAAGP